MKEIKELVTFKLNECKQRFIDLCLQHDDVVIQSWAQEWSRDHLQPPSYSHLVITEDQPLQLRTSFSPIHIALIDFAMVMESFDAGRVEEALRHLFKLEYYWGKIHGAVEEKKRRSKRNNKKRHKKNDEYKREAFEFYRQHDLSKLSNEKAAEILSKQVPLEVTTLKKAIAARKKQERLVKEHVPAMISNVISAIGANMGDIMADPKTANELAKLEKQIEESMLESLMT